MSDVQITEAEGQPYAYLLDIFDGDELGEENCPACHVPGISVLRAAKVVAIHCSWCRLSFTPLSPLWPEALT